MDVTKEEVCNAFSKYGLIFKGTILNMDKRIGPLPDTACAIVTFYLKSNAQAAIADSGSISIPTNSDDSKRIKLCAKVTKFRGKSGTIRQQKILSLEKCLEVINHFLGYCNWSSELKALSRYTKSGEPQNSVGQNGKIRVSMAATVIFTFLSSDKKSVCVRGRGIGTYAAKTLYDATEKARKFAVSAARRNGFKKIALIVNVREKSVIVETLDGSNSVEEIKEEFDEDPDVREGEDEEYDVDDDNDNNNGGNDIDDDEYIRTYGNEF